MYICPICRNPLERVENTYKCTLGHSYDISRRGYVNLLPPKHSLPGDNALMVKSRRDFLAGGYYEPFAAALCDMLSQYSPQKLLDAGCGEGYYTSRFPCDIVSGVDISKEAVELACRKSYRAASHFLSVASVFALPFCDGYFDGAVSIFSPICAAELHRTVRDGGFVIVAAPACDHLCELKAIAYDTVYSNDEVPPEIDGFRFVSCNKLRYTMNIDTNSQLMNLFSMTPYLYRTPHDGIARLESTHSLHPTAHFAIYTYLKKD